MATSGVGVVGQAGATMKMKNREEEEEEASLSPDLSHALGTGSKRVGGHGDWNGGDGDGNGGQNRSTVNILSNRPYIRDQAVADTRCTEDSDSNEGLKEQLAMVEAMVQDMKVSFMAALEQLSSLQEGDTSANTTTNNNNNTAATSAWQKMDSRCQRQDQQMSDLAKTIESLRKEVSMLSDSLQQMMNSQHSLQDQVLALQSGQQVLVQELVSAGILTNEKSREVLNNCQLQIQEGRLTGDTGQPRGTKVSDNTQGSQDQEKTDVTAAACKSLSLTQALAARCQDIDVSDSSEEDITSSRASRQQAMDHLGPALSLQAESPERRQAMQDIVDSEQEYCRQLWMVMQDYQQPLQDGHYMSSRQLCVLFPSPLADLYQQHSHMLQALQDRMAHASYASAVGDVFARMTDTNSNLLGLYQEYVESLPGAISCLRRQMSQSRSFRTFVKEQRESTSNSDLLTLLISPLQRIPKYMLQLQQVLRHTVEDHPDHFHLQASLGKLQDFVERFNHDITHTTQAIALDLQHLQTQGQSFRSSASNSSCEMLPPTTSTIDSGIQSTGEDALPTSFLRSGRAHHDGYQWVEQGYSHTDPKQAMRVPSGMQAQRQVRGQRGEWRLTSHSQPDLSHTGGYVLPNTLDPHSAVPHLRPFVNMATTQGDRSARQRRFKIKKRVEGQGQYRNGSPLRPASAMDFADGPEQEDRERGMMRPHSVLGPFTGDRRARVIQVHGRKPQRATQLTHQVTRSSPRVLVNGHWDPAAGGDPMGHQGHRIEQGGHYGPMVNYEDEEDDTRALSDAPSTGSHKASSRHSHDPHESETDNSDDFSQEDLAAALSLHLNNGAGGHPPHTVSAHELRVSHQHRQMHSSPRPSQHDSLHYQQQEEEEDDEQVDVHLDSTESDITPSLHQTQKPPQDMSEELKLDLTCFQDDNETKPTLLKRSQTSDPPENAQGPLSMKPAGSATNQNTNTVPQLADRSQTEPSKEVVNSLSGDKTLTSLPPIHPQDTLPNVADTNGRLIHAELERPPVRRSVTPNEFSNVARPAVLRRATTPSEFLGTPDVVSSKGGRRRKESKNTSNETLHRSVDDVSLSASKKKPFRTSLKNLFQRKKGCIILDQLEREYTKDLVRLCLVNSNTIPSTTAATTTTTTTTTLNNNIYNHSPQEEGKGQEGGNDKRDGPNHINHDLHHVNSPFSLWSKMKKSPLFSLPRRSDGAVTADSCVL